MYPRTEEDRNMNTFLAENLLSILEDPWDWESLTARGFLYFSPRQAARIRVL